MKCAVNHCLCHWYLYKKMLDKVTDGILLLCALLFSHFLLFYFRPSTYQAVESHCLCNWYVLTYHGHSLDVPQRKRTVVLKDNELMLINIATSLTLWLCQGAFSLCFSLCLTLPSVWHILVLSCFSGFLCTSCRVLHCTCLLVLLEYHTDLPALLELHARVCFGEITSKKTERIVMIL